MNPRESEMSHADRRARRLEAVTRIRRGEMLPDVARSLGLGIRTIENACMSARVRWIGKAFRRGRTSAIRIGSLWCRNIEARPAVYRLSNLTTGESYVGATSNLFLRAKSHAGKLVQGHSSHRLRECYDAHSQMLIEPLEYCIISELNAREQFWIRKLNPSLNARPDCQWAGSRKAIELLAGAA